MPSQDLQTFMWQLLEMLERRGAVKQTQTVTALCNACKSQHRRGWFDHIKTGDSFYLCIPTGKAVIEYQSTATAPSRRYSTVEWIDLINHLF